MMKRSDVHDRNTSPKDGAKDILSSSRQVPQRHFCERFCERCFLNLTGARKRARILESAARPSYVYRDDFA